MTLLHPVEQLAAFEHFFGRQRGRAVLELADQGAHALAHGFPVLDGEAVVGQRRLDFGLQGGCARRVVLPVDLKELPGLGADLPAPRHGEHGVDEEVYGHFGLGEHHVQCVDQEGHVVSDDQYQGVRGLEAVARRVGVQHSDEGLASLAGPAAHFEMQRGHGGERFGGALREVLLADAAEIIPQELPLGAVSRPGCDPLDECEACGGDASQWVAVVVGDLRVHGRRGLYTCASSPRFAARAGGV